jgi:preprotein translocase subunit SecE
MSTVTEEKVYRLDSVKWAIVALLVAVGVYGNSHFSDQAILYRALALLVLGAIAIVVAVNTAKGAAALELIRGAMGEWRKVVFPTRQEINQTTLLVLAVVAVTAIILAILDALFRLLASLIIG